jgi:hypothetical protein
MRTLCMPLEQAVGKSATGVRGRFCPQSSTPAPQLARTASTHLSRGGESGLPVYPGIEQPLLAITSY